ncbi:hypothetical protein [Methylomonas sp. CM2]|uniref:hypothetical protein n=1 Tax=Methylomonas sp. CM2 TaxID=3417647 RepID=UPI003CF8D8B2
MHKRRAILTALKAQIDAIAATPFGAACKIQRVPPAQNAMPTVTLFSESETVEHTTIDAAPRPQSRALTISVNVWLRGGSDPADGQDAEIKMDDYAELVEQTLAKPAGVDDLRLVSTEYREDDADPDTYVVALTYVVDYRTTERNPF